MKTLVDTNICIAIMNRDDRVRRALERAVPSQLRMSAVTLAELRYGVARSTHPNAGESLRKLLSRLGVVPFDEIASEQYGRLRVVLESRGTPIGPLDTLIAAHALSLKWTLATHNVRELRRVPGLRVADWLAPTAS